MTKTKLTKEEILNCLSDVIYFYSNEHKGGEGEDEEKEIAKNIEASEFIEDYFKKNYEKKEIIDNKTGYIASIERGHYWAKTKKEAITRAEKAHFNN